MVLVNCILIKKCVLSPVVNPHKATVFVTNSKDLRLYEKQTRHRLQKYIPSYFQRHPNNINWGNSSVFFLPDFEHVFVCWSIFSSNHSEEFLKITPLKRSGIFKEIYGMVQFLHTQLHVCLIVKKYIKTCSDIIIKTSKWH